MLFDPPQALNGYMSPCKAYLDKRLAL
jgi:hypothetical protein